MKPASCTATWTTQSGFVMSCGLAKHHAGDHKAQVKLRDRTETWSARPDQVNK